MLKTSQFTTTIKSYKTANITLVGLHQYIQHVFSSEAMRQTRRC